MFKAIRDGRASVVTDRIETFTERGIRLHSGRELEADVIITATGLNLLAFGGIGLSVDGVAVDVSQRVAFKGFLLSDVPNFAYMFGYTNSSWTLKVGLVCEHFCRLLAHMDAHGHHLLPAGAGVDADPAVAGNNRRLCQASGVPVSPAGRRRSLAHLHGLPSRPQDAAPGSGRRRPPALHEPARTSPDRLTARTHSRSTP